MTYIIGETISFPCRQEFCSKVFGGKELSTTMNADESVARGCALQAAMLSPLYKAPRELVHARSCYISVIIGV